MKGENRVMTEVEKIAYAKSFIDKLANGVNPLDGLPVNEADIVNNVRISRCFFYVSEILGKVIENGGTAPANKERKSKGDFNLSLEQRKNFKFSSVPIGISDIIDRMNDLINTDECKRISAVSVSSWLVDAGFLETYTRSDGRASKRPTKQGEEIGIVMEQRTGHYGEYSAVLYNENAQRFVIDNIDAILNFKMESKETKAFQGRAWDSAQDAKLISMFKNGMAVAEIAAEMQRSDGGIRARLKRLGLIESRYDAK